MSDRLDSAEVAEHLGRMEAQRFDQLLRDRERQELEERWSRVFPRPDLNSPATATAALGVQDRHTLERMIQFHNAVLKSRWWRVLQAIRRPLGRQW